MGVLSNKITRDQLKPGDHIYSWRQAYLYSHHGIYVGEEMVIHFTQGQEETEKGTKSSQYTFSSCPPQISVDDPCLFCGYHSKRDGVIRSCLDCFLSGGDLYLFEYAVNKVHFIAQVRGGTCTLASSDLPEYVLYRASSLLENGFGDYNLFKNNCEDFAIYCKTELLVQTSAGRSGQAATCIAAASTIGSLPLNVLTLFFSGVKATSVPGLGSLGCSMLYTYCQKRLASDIGARHDVSKVPVEELIARTRIEPEEEEEASNEIRTETHTTSMFASDIGDRHDVAKVPVEKPIVRNRIEPKGEDEASNEIRTETRTTSMLASDIGVRHDFAKVPVEKPIVRTRIEPEEEEASNEIRTETRATSMFASDIGDHHDVAKVPVEKPTLRTRIEPKEEDEASNEIRTETHTTSMSTGTENAGTMLNHTFSVKLDGKNNLLWKSLVSPIIRNHKLEGYILGIKARPLEFIPSTPGAGTAEWVADDQMIRGWLLTSLTKDVEAQVIGLDTSREVWKVLEDLWEAQNEERASNILHLAIQTTNKGSRTIKEYLSIMKQLADYLATVGKAISLSDLISFVSAGLDAEYSRIVVQVKAKDAISWQKLKASLLSYEKNLNRANNYKQQSQTSQYQHSGQTRFGAPNSGRNRGGGSWSRGRGGLNNNSKPMCQICGKYGHSARKCYNRGNFNYTGSFGSRNSSQSSAIPEMVGSKLS